MPNLQILRVKDVLKAIKVCRATLYLWIKAGTFPAPIKLGPRAIGWTPDQLEKWIESRAAVSAQASK
ncbi:AlpA family transcriptional regulator [Paracidovorax avenae]|uniref:helix-turn-helix transcriptional regulator n=1 Tax=Paracidovorax avenae TaxID=80867 RepID=UPI000D1623D8|nr:AlpA family phage regulatory protein [Paracidovorax avenae]AVS70985.1 AlpA family transcriptional regulator [Paracidovorax avenae]